MTLVHLRPVLDRDPRPISPGRGRWRGGSWPRWRRARSRARAAASCARGDGQPGGARRGGALYDAVQFTRAAVLADFYAPGDDLVIYTKRASRRSPWAAPSAGEAPARVDAPGRGHCARAHATRRRAEPALYDAAFGYPADLRRRRARLPARVRAPLRPAARCSASSRGPAGPRGYPGGLRGARRRLRRRGRLAAIDRLCGASPPGAHGAGACIRFSCAEGARAERPDVAPWSISFVPIADPPAGHAGGARAPPPARRLRCSCLAASTSSRRPTPPISRRPA